MFFSFRLEVWDDTDIFHHHGNAYQNSRYTGVVAIRYRALTLIKQIVPPRVAI